MKRPKIITAVCIAGFISVVFGFPQVFSPAIKKMGLFVPAIYGILVAAHFMACVGLWYFKQWGVRLFLLAFFAKTIFFMLTGQTGPGFYIGLALNLFFIVALLRHYSKMSLNL